MQAILKTHNFRLKHKEFKMAAELYLLLVTLLPLSFPNVKVIFYQVIRKIWMIC